MEFRTSAAFVAAALAVAVGSAGAAALPQAKTENGVTYISGGIGHDEAAAMKAEARNYPLSIVFSAGKDNEYLAGLNVTILDRKGKEVFKTSGAGPILLVKLPAGKYTITAQRNGESLRRAVQVTGHPGKQIALHWASA